MDVTAHPSACRRLSVQIIQRLYTPAVVSKFTNPAVSGGWKPFRNFCLLLKHNICFCLLSFRLRSSSVEHLPSVLFVAATYSLNTLSCCSYQWLHCSWMVEYFVFLNVYHKACITPNISAEKIEMFRWQRLIEVSDVVHDVYMCVL